MSAVLGQMKYDHIDGYSCKGECVCNNQDCRGLRKYGAREAK